LAETDSFEKLSELAYCLEEFRVQTWAQELVPAMPASLKRMEELFSGAELTLG
jgi:hypothetical protein